MLSHFNIESPVTPKNFGKLVLAFWVFLTLFLGFYSGLIYYYVQPATRDVWWDGYVYSGIYSAIFLGLFYLSWRPLQHHYPLNNSANVFRHVAAQTGISALGFVLGFFASGLVHGMVHAGSDFDQNAIAIELAITFLLCLIGILATLSFFYVRAFLGLNYAAQQLQTESQMTALRAQINPHFLFNTINSILSLIRRNPDEAERVLEDLAEIFRYSLKSSDYKSVSLSEELEIAKMYLEIEKARFGERLHYSFDVPKNLLQRRVPSLLLQPLVENSVKHVVNHQEGTQEVMVKVWQNNGHMYIQVHDSGKGFDAINFEDYLQKGTGLSNVYKRLAIEVGSEEVMKLNGDGVTLQIPDDYE